MKKIFALMCLSIMLFGCETKVEREATRSYNDVKVEDKDTSKDKDNSKDQTTFDKDSSKDKDTLTNNKDNLNNSSSNSSNSGNKDNSNNKDTTNENTNQPPSYVSGKFDIIKGTDIANLSKGKTIVIMIGRESCGYCTLYAPVLEKVQKEYNFKAKYIDLMGMMAFDKNGNPYISDEKSYDALTKLSGTGYEGWVEQNFGMTPTTLIVKDNKILYAGLGAMDEETLVKELVKVGISKK